MLRYVKYKSFIKLSRHFHLYLYEIIDSKLSSAKWKSLQIMIISLLTTLYNYTKITSVVNNHMLIIY